MKSIIRIMSAMLIALASCRPTISHDESMARYRVEKDYNCKAVEARLDSCYSITEPLYSAYRKIHNANGRASIDIAFETVQKLGRQIDDRHTDLGGVLVPCYVVTFTRPLSETTDSTIVMIVEPNNYVTDMKEREEWWKTYSYACERIEWLYKN